MAYSSYEASRFSSDMFQQEPMQMLTCAQASCCSGQGQDCNQVKAYWSPCTSAQQDTLSKNRSPKALPVHLHSGGVDLLLRGPKTVTWKGPTGHNPKVSAVGSRSWLCEFNRLLIFHARISGSDGHWYWQGSAWFVYWTAVRTDRGDLKEII